MKNNDITLTDNISYLELNEKINLLYNKNDDLRKNALSQLLFNNGINFITDSKKYNLENEIVSPLDLSELLFYVDKDIEKFVFITCIIAESYHYICNCFNALHIRKPIITYARFSKNDYGIFMQNIEPAIMFINLEKLITEEQEDITYKEQAELTIYHELCHAIQNAFGFSSSIIENVNSHSSERLDLMEQQAEDFAYDAIWYQANNLNPIGLIQRYIRDLHKIDTW